MHSGLIKNLKTGNQLGFIHSIIGSVYADFMVRPINFIKDEEEMDDAIDEELEFPLKDEATEVDEEPVLEELYETAETDDLESNEELTDDGEEEQVESVETKKDELDGLREILKQPVFVSALDMT